MLPNKPYYILVSDMIHTANEEPITSHIRVGSVRYIITYVMLYDTSWSNMNNATKIPSCVSYIIHTTMEEGITSAEEYTLKKISSCLWFTQPWKKVLHHVQGPLHSGPWCFMTPAEVNTASKTLHTSRNASHGHGRSCCLMHKRIPRLVSLWSTDPIPSTRQIYCTIYQRKCSAWRK